MGSLWIVDEMEDYDGNGIEDYIYFITHEDSYDPLHSVLYFNSIPKMMEGQQLGDVIQKYKNIQSLFRDKEHIEEHLFSEIFLVDIDEIKLWRYDRKLWLLFAERCGRFYYEMGLQIVYSIHWCSEYGYHIHFVGNAISYKDGRIWESDDVGAVFRESLFNTFFRDVGEIGRAEAAREHFERTYGCGDISDKTTKAQ